MAKYVITGVRQKTVGAYLKAVKALNELEDLGELLAVHPWKPQLTGVVGSITQDDETGEWHFVEA